MADPDGDHGLVYTDDGILDLDLSPFLDPEYGDDTTVDGYLERVRFLLKETIEAQLGINHWHQILNPDATLHPSYVALQRGLISRSSQSFSTAATTDIRPVSSTESGNGQWKRMADAALRHCETVKSFLEETLVALPDHVLDSTLLDSPSNHDEQFADVNSLPPSPYGQLYSS